MTTQVVRATFTRMASDGNYGHERAECTIEYSLADGEDPMSFAETLLEQCRHRVHMELAKSPSPAVRRAVGDVPIEPRRPLVAAGLTDDDDDLEDLPFDP